jgi:hypothetical protein
LQIGGGGETTRFVCGFFGCERHADRLFLSGLPMVIKINLRDDMAGQWLEQSIRHLVTEASSRRPGRSVLLSKMAEALFIEALRRYMEQLPAEQTGWLAAAVTTSWAPQSRRSIAHRPASGRSTAWPRRPQLRGP